MALTPEKQLLKLAQEFPPTPIQKYQALFQQYPGLNVNATDRKGRTALIFIAGGGYPTLEKIQYFLSLPGIDVTKVDNDGHDVLYYLRLGRQGAEEQANGMRAFMRTTQSRRNHDEQTQRVLDRWDAMINAVEEATPEEEEEEEDEGERIRQAEEEFDAIQAQHAAQVARDTGEEQIANVPTAPGPVEDAEEPPGVEEEPTKEVPKGGRKKTRRAKKQSRKPKKKATRKATKKNRRKE